MHPHQQHAIAAAWSLHAAQQRLLTAAVDEAQEIAHERLAAADGLRSPLYGAGRGSGGHSDPTAGASLTSAGPDRPNHAADLHKHTQATLTWLADQLGVTADFNPLARIHLAAARVAPATAANLHRWLAELDQRTRTFLGIPQDLWPLPGNPACPACQVRQLYAQTSRPATADWTVICAAGCRCTGPDCPCGMPVKAEGVTHIWASNSPLLEQHLATLGPRMGGPDAA